MPNRPREELRRGMAFSFPADHQGPKPFGAALTVASAVPGPAARDPGRRRNAIARANNGAQGMSRSGYFFTNVLPDGPMPVSWMITSPSFAQVKCGDFGGSE